MAVLTKEELLARVIESVVSSGWRPIVLQPLHPFRILATKEGQRTQTLLVYIWNVTSGGPVSVRPLGEFRIQLTGVTPPLQMEPDSQTLLLGWFDDLAVFVGFDVQRHATFSLRSPSIQVRKDTLEEADKKGLSFQSRGNNEIVAAFAPDQFMNYVLQQRNLHRFRQPPEIELLRTASIGTAPEAEDIEIVPRERREVIRTVVEWSRRRDFRIRVLNAYSHRCAVCRMQLELVEAAHIIPIGAPASNDQTTNGRLFAFSITGHMTML